MLFLNNTNYILALKNKKTPTIKNFFMLEFNILFYEIKSYLRHAPKHQNLLE